MNKFLQEALSETSRALRRHDSHEGHDHGEGEHVSGDEAEHDSHVEGEEHASHMEVDEEAGMSLTTFKIILTIFMFLEVYLGLIPKKVDWCTKSKLPLSFLNCFASGIFLAMAVVHILPEAVEIWEAYLKQEGIENGFPLPYFGYLVGYVLILFVDKVIAGKYHIHEDDDKVAQAPSSPAKPDTARSAEDGQDFELKPVPASPTKEQGTPVGGSSALNAIKMVKTDAIHEPVDKHAVSAVNGIILCIAIGVHEFFEGIAFGLMPTAEQAGQLAAGVLIHKGAAAISLGGTFSRTGFTFRQILLCLGLFSISAPIGIIIGMNLNESSLLVDTIFMSVAGGTFIYVACSEIIVHEFSRGGHGCVKLLLVIAGIVVITLLWLLDGGHSHGGDEEHASHMEEEFVPECLTFNRREPTECDEWSVAPVEEDHSSHADH